MRRNILTREINSTIDINDSNKKEKDESNTNRCKNPRDKRGRV